MFKPWMLFVSKTQRQARDGKRRKASEPRSRPAAEPLEERQLLSSGLDLTGVEFRTITGANNNVANPNQGAAETRQIRFGYGHEFPFSGVVGVDGFGDDIITPTSVPASSRRPNARSISNAIHAQGTSVPSGRNLTDWIFQWGQFLTHDIDLTRTGPEFNRLFRGGVGDFSIPILDPLDPLGPNPVPFNRSEFDPATGTDASLPGFPPFTPDFLPNGREVINSITSYIDGSVVYGSDPVRAAALRTGQGGKLRTYTIGGLEYLPYWDPASGLPNADRPGPHPLGAELFLAGDIRANENMGLTVSHTLFVREHNRLATRIAELYPTLNDEQIYQVARRIVGAEIQAITYEEYLPAVFGYDLAPRPEDAVYNPAVNATITNSFAHAVFRALGHTQINEAIQLVNNDGTSSGSLSIDAGFFNPAFLRSDTANFSRALLGLASQVGQETDLLLVDGIRNNLFGPPGAGGLDLGTLDIQRGRDHGLPNFNLMRILYGLPAVESFSQISSNPEIQATLQQLYGHVFNIDLFVGVLAEDHLPGTDVGPLMNAIMGNQFTRLRDGDRFFYTQDAFLNSAPVQMILDFNDVSLANIIRWNTDITNIQDNVFFDKSVLVIEGSDAGGNYLVVANSGTLAVVNIRTGQVLTAGASDTVRQLILVGSNTAADVFNLFIAADSGIEDGFVIYGGNSTGDRLNIWGTPLADDTFTVADSSFTTSRTDAFFGILEQSVRGRRVGLNGNTILSTGFETTRLVTLGGNDTITDPGSLASIVNVWDLLRDD